MYKLMKNSITNEICSVQIVEQPLTSIPVDPDNTDYKDYLACVENCGVPLPAEETQ